MLGPYQLNQIYTGECSRLMADLPADSIPFWLTSPPYDGLREYKGYTFDFEAIARQLWRITQPGGVGAWVVNDETEDGCESGTSFRQALYFMGLGFNLHDTMIWQKISPYQHNNRYIQSFEYMFIFSKGAPLTINLIKDRKNKWAGTQIHGTERQTNGVTKNLSAIQKSKDVKPYGARYNIWDIPPVKNNKTDHPAIFPEALARDHILSWSNPGDLVLDPMAGSGTSAKAAWLTGRNFLGFEISQEYTDLARRRLEATMSQPALFNPYQVEKAGPIQMALEAE